MNLTLVVPCYNEAERLDSATYLEFARNNPGVGFLFVNDGSSDGTGEVLARLCDREPDRLSHLNLARNSGKAEAVRQGMLAALQHNADLVGYWDADLATPLSEIPRFLKIMTDRPELVLVLGARVGLLGRNIQRTPARHYLGRLFATAVGVTLGLSIYDTQCGAKIFRVTDRTAEIFGDPFISRWIFDVELLARLRHELTMFHGPAFDQAVYEIPLMTWIDAPGSKVKPADFLTAFGDLVRIGRAYRSIPKR